MADWTREKALLCMTSPLGEDQLIPISLSAWEEMNAPFQFEIEAVSQAGVIDTNALLNQGVCVTLQSEGQPVRYFHGIVRHVADEGTVRGTGTAKDYERYRITAVARLWFLSQTTDCRVYQQLSTADILKAMFKDAGLTDMNIIPSGSPREYTVQFNETDLQFATRLMEEEGWFYFFTHEESKHTLVVADSNASFSDIPGSTLYVGGGDAGTTALTGFRRLSQAVRGKMTLKDYDPEKPDNALQAQEPTTLKTDGHETRDDFRWPAQSFDNTTVSNRTTWDLQAAEATASLFGGSTRFGGLVPGGTFKVQSTPAASQDGEYVVHGAQHHAADDSWLNQTSAASYDANFTSFPSSVTWRQPIVTPRPRMDGIHTALVMGPQNDSGGEIKSQSGEEIYTDDLGRVKVRFYWDWRAEAKGSAAVWARVVQPWAGKGWGGQFIPRVGTEVAVAFVDGDPDRPMVIGGLYNGRDTPIYKTDEKNKLGFRTRSVPQGAAGANFSEFTIDDTKGSELIFVHAEKDYSTEVENNQTLTVDNCRIVTVKKDETVDIQNDQTITVKNNHAMTVTGGNHDTTVKAGNMSLSVDSGSVTIDAAVAITLKVGGNSVRIDTSGVTVNGTAVSVCGATSTKVEAPITQVNADGMLVLKGGITTIN